METNKIFAAILTAGIIAYLAGFISHELTVQEPLKENAFKIEVTATAAPGETPAAPAKAEPINDLIGKADPAQGEKISKICAACHTFAKGDANKMGPNLAGIIGRARASHEGFAYSDAMKAKGGNWDVDSLNEFLFSPKNFVPGTKMSFAGLKKPEDRAALVKWLEAQK